MSCDQNSFATRGNISPCVKWGDSEPASKNTSTEVTYDHNIQKSPFSF